MSYWKSYTPPRYTILHKKWYDKEHPRTKSFQMVCKICGFTYGDHFGNDSCPDKDKPFNPNDVREPEFFSEKLADNTRTL